VALEGCCRLPHPCGRSRSRWVGGWVRAQSLVVFCNTISSRWRLVRIVPLGARTRGCTKQPESSETLHKASLAPRPYWRTRRRLRAPASLAQPRCCGSAPGRRLLWNETSRAAPLVASGPGKVCTQLSTIRPERARRFHKGEAPGRQAALSPAAESGVGGQFRRHRASDTGDACPMSTTRADYAAD